jgi:hypothetical protein
VVATSNHIEISEVMVDDAENWNQIVHSFHNYDIYYLLGYSKAFEVHGDGQPTLFYYKDHNIKAMNVVMKRDVALDDRFRGKIPLDTYYDISTPYGYGGFLIEGNITNESLESLEHHYETICKKKGIVCEFVRFHPVLNNANILKGMYDVTTLGKTVTIDLTSQEQLWANISSKNRNMIRKARKSGVEIFWGRSPQLIEKFIELYYMTMKKDNAAQYYYFSREFFNSILFDMKHHSLIFYAVYEGNIVSMAIILYGNHQIHYHLSASEKEYQHLAPTNLLLYEVACWGCENGYKTFHLGGGVGSQEDSLYNFKKVFNKNSNTLFSIGKKIFMQDVYDNLLQMRMTDIDFNIRTAFFPAYRG